MIMVAPSCKDEPIFASVDARWLRKCYLRYPTCQHSIRLVCFATADFKAGGETEHIDSPKNMKVFVEIVEDFAKPLTLLRHRAFQVDLIYQVEGCQARRSCERMSRKRGMRGPWRPNLWRNQLLSGPESSKRAEAVRNSFA